MHNYGYGHPQFKVGMGFYLQPLRYCIKGRMSCIRWYLGPSVVGGAGIYLDFTILW